MRRVVLHAVTRHRYSLSKGGKCSCGGSLELDVHRDGRFSRHG